jgi:hypothetical protein
MIQHLLHFLRWTKGKRSQMKLKKRLLMKVLIVENLLLCLLCMMKRRTKFK